MRFNIICNWKITLENSQKKMKAKPVVNSNRLLFICFKCNYVFVFIGKFNDTWCYNSKNYCIYSKILHTHFCMFCLAEGMRYIPLIVDISKALHQNSGWMKSVGLIIIIMRTDDTKFSVREKQKFVNSVEISVLGCAIKEKPSKTLYKYNNRTLTFQVLSWRVTIQPSRPFMYIICLYC